MKSLKAWAVVSNGKILTVAQEPVLEIYRNGTHARQAVFYINRNSFIKYEMEIVRVEIRKVGKKLITKKK
jgi:hypothetical protein